MISSVMMSSGWMVAGIALCVLLGNIPLGRLRAGAKKYSWRNFGCILAPVPMVVAMRLMLGLSIKVAPVFLLAAIAGQRIGIWTTTRMGDMQQSELSQHDVMPRTCDEQEKLR